MDYTPLTLNEIEQKLCESDMLVIGNETVHIAKKPQCTTHKEIRFLAIGKETKRAIFFITQDSTFCDSKMGFWCSRMHVLDILPDNVVIVKSSVAIKIVPFYD